MLQGEYNQKIYFDEKEGDANIRHLVNIDQSVCQGPE